MKRLLQFCPLPPVFVTYLVQTTQSGQFNLMYEEHTMVLNVRFAENPSGVPPLTFRMGHSALSLRGSSY